MRHFTPTFDVSSTISNVAEFVKKHENEVWKIFLPLMPFVFLSFLLDFVVNEFIYTGSEREFIIGEHIAKYFFVCMSISWLRFAIKGPDNYTPMSPFKPQKDELTFIGIWLLIYVVPEVVFDFVYGLEGEQWELLHLLFIPVIIALFYFSFKVVFYFPAKAVGAPISFDESFRMTRGCFWKIVFSQAFSFIGLISYWIKPIVIWLVCVFVFFSVVLIWLVLNGVDPDSIGVILTSNPIMVFIQELPLNLYFFPIFVAVFSMITANYYLYVLQNPKGES